MTPIRTSSHRHVFTKDDHIASSRHGARRAGRHQFARHARAIPGQSPGYRQSSAVSRPGIRASVSSTISAIAGKADLALQKRLHGNLIGRIQRAGGATRRPPGTGRPASAAETCRNPAAGIPTCRASLQSILGTGASRAVGIGQRVLDRHPHVGRRDLRDHAAIGVFDHGMHRGLRVNHHIHLRRARNRTASRPRSPRSPCSSRSPSRW